MEDRKDSNNRKIIGTGEDQKSTRSRNCGNYSGIQVAFNAYCVIYAANRTWNRFRGVFTGREVMGSWHILLGGNSQGRDSLNRPLAMVESFPFEKY
jgi:hypothetical protein